MSIFNNLIIYRSSNDIKLREEDDHDNIEYKLRLDSKNKLGIKKLSTQLNYRLDIGKFLTGKKIAHYVLGINDDGSLGKLNESELDETFNIFNKLINDTGSTIEHLDKLKFDDYYMMYLIIQKTEKNKIKEINVAFVGPSQHGKTTTISNLVYNQIDDGNGLARKLIFKHDHEKLSGVTSCIKKEIIGLFNGNIINFGNYIQSSLEDIVHSSDKIVNLIDLPGDNKYLRTTFFGLCSYRIDALVIVIDVLKPEKHEIISFYKTYASLLNIPYKILLINSKSDPELDDYITISNLNIDKFDKIGKFFNSIEPTNLSTEEKKEALFTIVDIYFIPDSGIIFSGIMTHGSLSLKQEIYLLDEKNTYTGKIKSIHRKQIDSHTLYDGETGAIQLDLDMSKTSEINKHMIISTLPLSNFTILNNIKFEIKNKTENYLKIGTISLLFIGNNIIQVVPTIYISKNIINLKCLDKSVLLTIDLNQFKVAFLKNMDDIYIGTILSIVH